MRTRIFTSILCLTLLPGPATATVLTGQVQFNGRSGSRAVGTFVYAERLDGPTVAEPSVFALVHRNKLFSPRVLAVPVGSRIDFPNEDVVFHNVFSLSPPDPFDLGLYRAGAAKSRTFERPGMYRVFCNIHPHMTAAVLVVPTSIISETDTAGRFRLDVPPGRYRLTAWSERAMPASIEVEVGTDSVEILGLRLDESLFVEAAHPDKHGRPYRAPAYSPLGRSRGGP